MTSEANPDEDNAARKSAENKAVFAPLGKYVVVAVLLVTVIVTTAIMLDTQLNTAQHQIAVFESEVAASYERETEIRDIAATSALETQTSTQNIAVVAHSLNNTSETAAKATTEPPVQINIDTVGTTNLPTPTADSDTIRSTENNEQEAPVELATAETMVENFPTQNPATNPMGADTFKIEQKKRSTEMFARVKLLETQQLDRYKQQQDSQIERLRAQIPQQQQMIESLILRNKGLFELRETNIQRNQKRREESLNHI